MLTTVHVFCLQNNMCVWGWGGVGVCVRACVRACVHACVGGCVGVRACVRACACVIMANARATWHGCVYIGSRIILENEQIPFCKPRELC